MQTVRKITPASFFWVQRGTAELCHCFQKPWSKCVSLLASGICCKQWIPRKVSFSILQNDLKTAKYNERLQKKTQKYCSNDTYTLLLFSRIRNIHKLNAFHCQMHVFKVDYYNDSLIHIGYEKVFPSSSFINNTVVNLIIYSMPKLSMYHRTV